MSFMNGRSQAPNAAGSLESPCASPRKPASSPDDLVATLRNTGIANIFSLQLHHDAQRGEVRCVIPKKNGVFVTDLSHKTTMII